MSDVAHLKPLHDLSIAGTRMAFAALDEDAFLGAAGLALSALAIVTMERLGLETAREMLTDIALDVTERAMAATAASS